jgi:P-type Cu+ transporter
MRDDAVLDPVCGMRLRPQEAAASLELGEKKYFFCCKACLRSFEADPHRYLRREEEVHHE